MQFDNIRNLREDSDLTQQDLADYLNVKQTTYSKYELGKINVPIEVFIKLADYYNVSIDYLVGRSKKKEQVWLPFWLPFHGTMHKPPPF